jgi:hypothetical protein
MLVLTSNEPQGTSNENLGEVEKDNSFLGGYLQKWFVRVLCICYWVVPVQ